MNKILLQIIIFLYLLTTASGIINNILFKIFILSLVLCSCVINISLVKHKTRKWNRFYFISLIFYLILVLTGLRFNNPEFTFFSEIFKVMLFSLLLLAIYAHALGNKSMSSYLFNDLIITPISLLVIINFLYYIFDINFLVKNESQYLGEGVVLNNFFGISLERINFPFVSNVVTFGVLSGVLFLGSLYSFFGNIKIKSSLFGILLGSLGLLVVDFRSGIFSVFFTVLYVFLARKKVVFFVFPAILFFGPILLLILSSWVVENGFGDIISRNQYELETGNSRFIIWAITLSEIIDFKWIHLIGYGQFGAFASGRSYEWANFFIKFPNPYLTSAHNTYFNLFYDAGYVGIALYLLLSLYIFKMLSLLRRKQVISNQLISFFVFFGLIGISDSTIGFHSTIHLLIFCIPSIILLTSKEL
jgi:hypothetical protein